VVYLGFFLFQAPGYMPPLQAVMRDTFAFCGICWLLMVPIWKLGTLGRRFVHQDGHRHPGVAYPITVAGYAIVDFWRGLLPLSEFKQYGVYFALSIPLLDITFNAMIMARLSRRYLGEVPT
jgi:hypothetical protein